MRHVMGGVATTMLTAVAAPDLLGYDGSGRLPHAAGSKANGD